MDNNRIFNYWRYNILSKWKDYSFYHYALRIIKLQTHHNLQKYHCIIKDQLVIYQCEVQKI